MYGTNPNALIQIPIWDSSTDDDELREDNIGHDDDVDNTIDEENGIDGLLESLYVHVDDEERDGDERDDDLERDRIYITSKNKLYEGKNITILLMILLLMNIKSQIWMVRYKFHFSFEV